MSYKIEYTTEIVKKSIKKQRNRRLLLLTACFFILFLLCAHHIWPHTLRSFRGLIFPDGSAVEVLISDLQNGTDFLAAVDAFCNQLIDYE